MPDNHITNSELRNLMERFLSECPYGDSNDLARYMYNEGYSQGAKDRNKNI